MSGDEQHFTIVYLPEFRCSGQIVSQSAHFARVKYYKGGIEYIIDVNNEDFIERGSIGFEVEDE